jgi:hypothetical protein
VHSSTRSVIALMTAAAMTFEFEAKITLADSKGKMVSEDTTILDGKFTLVAPTPGLYTLCRDMENRQNCLGEVSIQNEYTTLDAIVTRFEGAQIYGRVLTGNTPLLDTRSLLVAGCAHYRRCERPAECARRTANAHRHRWLLLLLTEKPYRLNVVARCEKATQATTVDARSIVSCIGRIARHNTIARRVSENASGRRDVRMRVEFEILVRNVGSNKQHASVLCAILGGRVVF